MRPSSRLSRLGRGIGRPFSGTVDTVTPGNLVLNPSFEVDGNADGLADSWSNYNDIAFFSLVAATAPGHGSHAQRIDPSAGQSASVNQTVPAVANHAYTLHSEYLIHFLSGGQTVRKVEWYAADGTTLLGYNYSTDNSSTTHQSTDDVWTSPAGTSFANVVLAVEGGGQTDFDFVSLL